MKNGYRAAPILVALAVLFMSVLGLRSVVHAQALGTVEIKTFGAIAALAADSTTSTTDVAWATTASTTESVNDVAIRLEDADLGGVNPGGSTTTVTVKSDTDSVGFSLTLTEVASTSIFTASLTLTTSTNSAASQLAAEHGDTVTVEYTDANTAFGTVTIPDTMSVDTEGPEISALDPGDGTVTDSVSSYTAEIVDTDSGVAGGTVGTGLTTESISFLVNTAADNVGAATVVDAFFQSLADITDGKTVTMSGLSLSGNVWITVRATDLAGNSTVFDSDVLDGAKEMAKLVIDTGSPSYDEAFTGVGWDNIAKALTFNDNNSIVLIFSDALTGLDGDSVTAADFSVDDNTVTRADVFSAGSVTSSIDGLETVDTDVAVFLTLGTDLAPDEAPTVTIVGSGVADEAGNDIVTGSQDAADRIDPTITVDSISPTLGGDGDTVTVAVSSDELLKSDDITVVITALDSNTTLANSVVDAGTNAWTITTAAVDESTAYSISITGQDDVNNAGSVGVAGDFDPDDESDDVIFEGDVGMPAPRVTPADAGEPVVRDPLFITIDFGVTSTGLTEHEGNEYDGDSQSTVTLTVLTLDGADILGQEDTKNDVRFLVAVSDIALGEHTITVNAEDEAGNSLVEDLSVTFTVIERPSVDIDLEPGWNLISFPGDPSDGSIDAVFADNAAVTAVVTYDPARPGGFLSAIREDDGSFAGTLSTITADRGYWINTDAFETVEADIPGLQAGQVGLLPPTIPITAGWNLVPVRDVVGNGVAGATIVSNVYFASIAADIAAVYFYDTISNTWQFLTVGAGTNVEVGKAYWVYTTDAGVLVPAGTPANP